MLTFIKLGGSLITDKRKENTFRPDVAARAASEIRAALDQDANLRILIGHGSGSFGHVAAKRHDTIQGVNTREQWHGFADVAAAAAALNTLMSDVLRATGIPILRFQPSTSALARDGQLQHIAVDPIQRALDHGLIPLLYGDVAFDAVRGGTIISTETIFFYLAQQLPVKRIFLLGEVDGVYDQHWRVISIISPQNLAAVETALGGSEGTDVTGGMETKVRDMLALVQRVPGLEIRIFNGTAQGLLHRALLNEAQPGTLITTG